MYVPIANPDCVLDVNHQFRVSVTTPVETVTSIEQFRHNFAVYKSLNVKTWTQTKYGS